MRTFIAFYAGTPCASHRKTEVFVMDRRSTACHWPKADAFSTGFRV